MKLEHDFNIQEYLEGCDYNTAEFLNGQSLTAPVILDIEKYLTKELWVGELGLNTQAGWLCGHAYSMWLASLRLASSGHAAAVTPVVRAALESACYSLVIQKDNSLAETWKNRHLDEASKKASRTAFNSAVKNAAKTLNSLNGFGDKVNRLYESCIDFGAHPNPLSIAHNIHREYLTESTWNNHIGILYNLDQIQAKRGLLFCTDVGVTIAYICTEILDATDLHRQRLAGLLLSVHAAVEAFNKEASAAQNGNQG